MESRWEPQLGTGLGLRAHILGPGTATADAVRGLRYSSRKEVKLLAAAQPRPRSPWEEAPRQGACPIWFLEMGLDHS